MRLVIYVRGGLGDIWPTVCAIKPIVEEYHIPRSEITIITDSVYYFRSYPPKFAEYGLRMLEKITSNIIMVPSHINDNFRLTVNDVTDEFSQESVDNNLYEFMFWRPVELKEFVRKHISPDTIFIDAFFTECILNWDFRENKYNRIGDKRSIIEFNPSSIERNWIKDLLIRYPKHILIHIKKKEEGSAVTQTDKYYEEILRFCNKNNIIPFMIGSPDVHTPKDISLVSMCGTNILTFEGMAYLIDKCKVMLGNDSGFSAIKLYQQQKDKLLIMDHPRWSRSPWYFRAIKNKSNCLLLDARNKNIEEIKKAIGEYYK